MRLDHDGGLLMTMLLQLCPPVPTGLLQLALAGAAITCQYCAGADAADSLLTSALVARLCVREGVLSAALCVYSGAAP